MYISMAASTALIGFVVLSVILFIIDGIKAKRQQRKAGITVMFIIAMILEAVFIPIKWIEIPPPERKSIFLYWACYNPYRGATLR